MRIREALTTLIISISSRTLGKITLINSPPSEKNPIKLKLPSTTLQSLNLEQYVNLQEAKGQVKLTSSTNIQEGEYKMSLRAYSGLFNQWILREGILIDTRDKECFRVFCDYISNIQKMEKLRYLEKKVKKINFIKKFRKVRTKFRMI